MPRAKATKTTRKTVKSSAADSSVKSSPVNLRANVEQVKMYAKKPWVLPVAALIILGILLYTLKGLFVVATINGQPITRVALDRELEDQYGKATLNSLVTKTLILQEAQKEHVTISDDEVNTEMNKIKDNVTKQGQNFNDLLKAQNLTEDKLKDQIKIEKLIQKMVGKNNTVTDQEVDDYITKNKDSFPADSKPEDLRPSVRQQLEQQQLSDKFQTWIADLQKKATINYIVNF